MAKLKKVSHDVKKVSFYNHNAVDLYNNNKSFSDYRENVILIVNAGRHSVHVE